MKSASRDHSLEEDTERYDWIPPGGVRDVPPLAHVEFRSKPELEAMVESASPNGAYLVLELEPDGEGAIVYTNLPRDLVIKMVVATLGRAD